MQNITRSISLFTAVSRLLPMMSSASSEAISGPLVPSFGYTLTDAFPAAITCHRLNGNNYLAWSQSVRLFLIGRRKQQTTNSNLSHLTVFFSNKSFFFSVEISFSMARSDSSSDVSTPIVSRQTDLSLSDASLSPITSYKLNGTSSSSSSFRKQQNEELQQIFSNLSSKSSPNALMTTEGSISYLATNNSLCWIVDSGASDHMTGNRSLFSTFNSHKSASSIKIADGSLSTVKGSGSIKLNDQLVLSNVLYVPNLACNLLSVSKLIMDVNCDVNFGIVGCVFQAQDSKRVIGSARLCNGLYILDGLPSPNSVFSTCLQTSVSSSNLISSEIMLWHYRAEYNLESDLLDEEFMLKGKWYQRKDIEVKNGRGDVLQCSHYVPLVGPEGKSLPCVIYCHGNSGCRADASEAAIILLPSNITVFTLDFSGSGLSGGEHVTLGWNEKDDLKAVVDYLRADGNVSLIGLWGRSMGAVTSLMYGAEDPSIAGMVLDSPFSDLVDLMLELVDTYKFRLPKFTVKFAIQFMRKSVQKKAKFDIADLNTIKVAKSCFVPVLFGHAIGDDFIRPHHSDRIFEAYMGDKNIIKFEGDHNSPRPQFYFDSINIFFHNVLQPPDDEVGTTFYDSVHDYFGKGSWVVPEVSFFPDSSAASKATSSTSDAINQVRSKRPMSRTEVPSEENNPRCQQNKDTIDDNGSSSSNMISFELSNGHPFYSHVPTTMYDDQYVEYELDDLTDFPCNVEEEERMFLEAIIESLKDLDMRHPEIEKQPRTYADSSESLRTEDINSRDACCTAEKCSSVPLESTSTQVEHHQSSSVVDGSNVGLEQASPHTSVSALGHAFVTPPTEESGSTSISTQTDTSASTQSSSDADMSGSTKASVTVVRNPSGNVVDG